MPATHTLGRFSAGSGNPRACDRAGSCRIGHFDLTRNRDCAVTEGQNRQPLRCRALPVALGPAEPKRRMFTVALITINFLVQVHYDDFSKSFTSKSAIAIELWPVSEHSSRKDITAELTGAKKKKACVCPAMPAPRQPGRLLADFNHDNRGTTVREQHDKTHFKRNLSLFKLERVVEPRAGSVMSRAGSINPLRSSSVGSW